MRITPRRTWLGAEKLRKNRSVCFGFLVRLFFVFVLVALVIGGYWVYQLDRKVVAQFEGKKWAVPAHVYARPQELYAGLKLSQTAFVDQLERLGYRQVSDVDRMASYSIEEPIREPDYPAL